MLTDGPSNPHLPSVTPVCLFTLTNDLLRVMNWELIAIVLKRRREQDQKQQPQRLAFPYMYDIHCVWHFAPRQHGDFQTRLLTEGCISWKLLKCMYFVFLETNSRTFLEILQNLIFGISVPEMFPLLLIRIKWDILSNVRKRKQNWSDSTDFQDNRTIRIF